MLICHRYTWRHDESVYGKQGTGDEFARPNTTFSLPSVSMRIAVIIVRPSNIKYYHEIDEFGRKGKQDNGLVVSKGIEEHSNERI
jgi:hypothetical protein